MQAELTSAVPVDDTPLPSHDDPAAGDAHADPQADSASAEAAGGAADAAAAADGDVAALEEIAGDTPVGFIPEGRFKELVAQKNDLTRQNAQLLGLLGQSMGGNGAGAAAAAAQEVTPRDFESEFDALADAYDAGKIDDRAYRKQERELIRAQAKAESEAAYGKQIAALQAEHDAALRGAAEQAWTAEVAKTVKAYPFLNHQAPQANTEAIQKVRAEAEELVSRGIDPARALRLAVAEIAPQYGTAVRGADEVTAARAAKARRAAGEAEAAQPPALGGSGNGGRNTSGKRVLTASVRDHDQWAKTPESERGNAFIAG